MLQGVCADIRRWWLRGATVLGSRSTLAQDLRHRRSRPAKLAGDLVLVQPLGRKLEDELPFGVGPRACANLLELGSRPQVASSPRRCIRRARYTAVKISAASKRITRTNPSTSVALVPPPVQTSWMVIWPVFALMIGPEQAWTPPL